MTPQIIHIILIIIKVFVLVGLGLYSIFAAIIIRQEQLMANVLEESFEPVLRMFTIAHFIASLGVLVIAMVFL